MWHRVWILMLVTMLAAGACESGELDEDEPPEGLGDIELVPYEDERLSFLRPDGWEETTSEEDEEHKVRVELRPRGADHLHALITAVWPLPPYEDLDALTKLFGARSDNPGVSGFEEQSIDVTGADEAVLQRFRSTEAVAEAEKPADVWIVLARAEGGHAMGFTVLVLEGAGIHAQSLAEEVISSLQLKAGPDRADETEDAEEEDAEEEEPPASGGDAS